MASKFGLLAKLTFLQDLASILIARINPSIIHNIEKYKAIKKVHFLSSIEAIEGDYLEFGVFTGSSMSHSIRCAKALLKDFPSIGSTRFFGFDSFEGFGSLDPIDEHPFYVDENFATNYENVRNRIQSVAGNKFDAELIQGFFTESLADGPKSHGISHARIIFLDSDTYNSSKDVFRYCSKIIQPGTYLLLDDFFSYQGDKSRGVARAFYEFVDTSQIDVRQVFTYGNGGVAYVISSVPNLNPDI